MKRIPAVFAAIALLMSFIGIQLRLPPVRQLQKQSCLPCLLAWNKPSQQKQLPWTKH